MDTENSRSGKTRMIHVRLPETMHKKVRVHAAEADQTIQDWVLQAIQYKLEHHIENIEIEGNIGKQKG